MILRPQSIGPSTSAHSGLHTRSSFSGPATPGALSPSGAASAHSYSSHLASRTLSWAPWLQSIRGVLLYPGRAVLGDQVSTQLTMLRYMRLITEMTTFSTPPCTPVLSMCLCNPRQQSRGAVLPAPLSQQTDTGVRRFRTSDYYQRRQQINIFQKLPYLLSPA